MAISSSNKSSLSSGSETEILVDRLVLDIKALMLLGQSDPEFAHVVEDKIAQSHDIQVESFVDLMQTKSKSTGVRGLLFIAIGEMVLASILSISGIAVLAPSLTGLVSPAQLIVYFSEMLSYATQSTLNPIVPIVEFLLALLLLLGAFYSLRAAAINLRETKLADSN